MPEIFQRFAGDRGAWVSRVSFDADVYGGVVEVVLDAPPVNDLQPKHVIVSRVDVGTDADPPPPHMPAQIEGVAREKIVPGDVAKRAAELQVSPVRAPAIVAGEVGHRKTRL